MTGPSTRKVKITKPVIVNGKHAAAGDVHELPANEAQELIGAGTAEEHLEEGQETRHATTVRDDSQVQHRDPTMAQHADPVPHKRKS